MEDKSIFEFLQKLIGDMNSQSLQLGCLLFGPKFLNLGLTKKDKSVNDRLKIYKAWGKQVLDERVEEIKSSF